MQFCQTYRIITETNLSNALQLSPATLAELLTQNRKDTNLASDSDCLNIGDWPYDFKVHRKILFLRGLLPLDAES